jgi:intein-encoded DNA endonuclease-like protein
MRSECLFQILNKLSSYFLYFLISKKILNGRVNKSLVNTSAKVFSNETNDENKTKIMLYSHHAHI